MLNACLITSEDLIQKCEVSSKQKLGSFSTSILQLLIVQVQGKHGPLKQSITTHQYHRSQPGCDGPLDTELLVFVLRVLRLSHGPKTVDLCHEHTDLRYIQSLLCVRLEIPHHMKQLQSKLFIDLLVMYRLQMFTGES